MCGGVDNSCLCPRPSLTLLPCPVHFARALGDIDFKEPKRFVEAEPDVLRLVMQPGDAFVIVASDGLWDVLSDQVRSGEEIPTLQLCCLAGHNHAAFTDVVCSDSVDDQDNGMPFAHLDLYVLG